MCVDKQPPQHRFSVSATSTSGLSTKRPTPVSQALITACETRPKVRTSRPWRLNGRVVVTVFTNRLKRLAAMSLAPVVLAGCGVNTIPTNQERAKAAWADVQSQYQRRADLVPNLVATVQGYANQEKTVLVAVTQARASATK
jgi:hypothetical protein